MRPLAALTGGTGFLGRHTIRALHDAGWDVRILARRTPQLPELNDLTCEVVKGDLNNQAALRTLCDCAHAVIHIAGVVKAPDEAAFMAANAQGAANVAAAWRAAAPGAHFVHVSSMAARAPHLSHYATSKRAGEEAIKGIGEWRILRPGAIYGAHDSESLKVLKLANAPVQLMLNAAETRIGMIDVRDAARMVAAAAGERHPDAVHELVDMRRDGYRWDELAQTAAIALGKTPRGVRLPAAVLKTAGAVGGALARLTGSAEMLTPGKVREILHPDWSADPTMPAASDLPEARISLADGLKDMVIWARRAGRL
ncbi:MAG: SDR family oxidoreductase [Pikeienuella sp.]